MKELYKQLDPLKTFILLVSLALYMVSLTQTAITYNDYDGQKTLSSLSLLMIGGIAFLGGGLLETIIWWANPLYFLALVMFFKSSKTSRKVSAAAAILSLTFTTWDEILAAESGRTGKIESLNLGYWLWLFSMAIFAIGSLLAFKKTTRGGSGSGCASA